MDWDTSKFKLKEEKKEKALKRGKAAIMNLARDEMARILGKKKKRNPRVEALERAGEEWKTKEEIEKRKKRQKEAEQRREKFVSPIEIVKAKTEWVGKAKDKKSEYGIVDWLKQGMESWKKKTGIEPKEKKKSPRPNSALMGVIVRSMVNKERARAFGKRLPDPRVVALEQEAAQLKLKTSKKN